LYQKMGGISTRFPAGGILFGAWGTLLFLNFIKRFLFRLFDFIQQTVKFVFHILPDSYCRGMQADCAKDKRNQRKIKEEKFTLLNG